MKKTALILMVLTILSKFLGFIREIVLAYFYGASNISDAFLISLTIPTIIFHFIGVGIYTTYIPMYNNILKEEGNYKANSFTNSVTNLVLIISTIIIFIVLLFTEQIVMVFASGFKGDTLELAIILTKITIFSIYSIGILYIFQGYLQVKNNFIIPALIGLPLSLVLITSIILSTQLNIKVLAYGKVLASIAQLLFILPFLLKSDLKYQLELNLKDDKLRKMISLSLPVILGTSVNQVNMLIDRTLASRVAVGGISSLTYAHKLTRFVEGIFIMSIGTVFFALISKMTAEKNMKNLKNSLIECIGGINLLVLPTTVGAMFFAEPVVIFLFSRGAFDLHAVNMTSNTLFFYSIGLVALGLREVVSRVFYSMQDTRTPMVNASIGMVLNIILNFILVEYLGVGGLALATSISAIFTTGLMFISLRKKIGPFGMKQISISFVKILFASLIMGAIAKVSFNYMTANVFSQNLSLMIAIGIGALTYFTIIYFMKIDDVDVIVNAVKKKLKRSKAHA